ncbi:MAG: PEP-utilizing enzyme [Candidatus Paceibacterota bacterium]|jgi:phosphohistidine swiveling domain-containing protein
MLDIKEFYKGDWVYSFTRRMTYQKIRLYHYGYWNTFSKLFGVKQKYECFRVKSGNMETYLAKDEIESFESMAIKKFTDSNFIKNVVTTLAKNIINDFDNYLSFLHTLKPFIANDISDADLIDILERYYSFERNISADFWILFNDVEHALGKAIRQHLALINVSETEADNILHIISEPIYPNPLEMELISLYKIALLDKDIMEKHLIAHIEEYCYMPMYDINYEPNKPKYYTERLSELLKKDREVLRGELNNLENKYIERRKISDRTLNQYKENEEVFILLNMFVSYSYLKDKKPYIRDKGGYYVKPLFERIAKKIKLTLDQTLFLNESEIKSSILEGKSVISRETLDLRQQNSLYFCENDKIIVVTDRDELQLIDNSLHKEETIKELKGTGVAKGNVSGRVSIVLSNSDFLKFKKGDILVSSATRPDFVPLMEKALAIITDEGGLLSHAAIVSRELKKPCIVGTKNATKVLKDGDMVEVDANKGIVKIIK